MILWPHEPDDGNASMKKALLDTDITSEVIREKNSTVLSNANRYLDQYGEFTFSAVTITEMVQGWHKIQEERRVQLLLVSMEKSEIIPLGIEEAIVAGRIAGDLDRNGIPIGNMDPFIAATAIVHDLSLVTGNTRHFQRVIDLGYPLELQNWRLPNG